MSEEFPDEAYPAASTVVEPNPGHVTELHMEDPDTSSWQQDFVGLLQLGAVRGWFEWCGHRIAIKTLTTDEELLVAQLIREFEGGLGGMKAYSTATAGLCVEAIDNQPMPVPLGEQPNAGYAWALQRFNYARRWFPPTIDAIMDAYLDLEKRQRAVMAGLGKVSVPEVGLTPGLSARSASPSAGDS